MNCLPPLGAFVVASALLMAQAPPVPSLTVTGAVRRPLTLGAEDLRTMPRASVTATIHGTAATYQGVWLAEILKQAGVPLGKDLRGDSLLTYVLARAEDGYAALYSLPELDPSFHDNDVLVADSRDGKPLPAAEGALRLVAPKDKPGARSVRMLKIIEVVQVKR